VTPWKIISAAFTASRVCSAGARWNGIEQRHYALDSAAGVRHQCRQSAKAVTAALDGARLASAISAFLPPRRRRATIVPGMPPLAWRRGQRSGVTSPVRLWPSLMAAKSAWLSVKAGEPGCCRLRWPILLALVHPSFYEGTALVDARPCPRQSRFTALPCPTSRRHCDGGRTEKGQTVVA
jgi:hypothetical protein